MSNINPVLILPAPLAARGGQIAASSVASLTLGAGQFCTNPGLILAPEGRALEDSVAKRSAALANGPISEVEQAESGRRDFRIPPLETGSFGLHLTLDWTER
jgi:hypothetical protein